ncbi:MAG: ABC transporter substrate-binding protein [Chloroflexi bacterium]|nr:ABC transporter substrate-binding protein [Chloroflexota bacterium]
MSSVRSTEQRGRPPLLILVILAVLLLVVSTACQGGKNTSVVQQQPSNVTLRLGYFPNVTHSQPIVGLQRGTFQQALGPNVKLDPKTFNAGPSAIEALFAGEIDATYIGPNPAINGYIKSNGEALRIVAGATSGGALFVVRQDSGITKPADLAGKRIASPQLGNTQDVALRAYLLANGLASKENGGNVEVIPTANPDILTLFKKGEINGAWVPEPWGTRLVGEANGRLFLDERTLWPNGDFVTTHLIVRTEFLEKHPAVVENLLRAHVETTLWINGNQREATELVVKGIREVTGATLALELVSQSWQNLRITYDPIASSLRKSADDAFKLGFLGNKNPDLRNIYALDPLNKVLKEKNLKSVSR